jgi:ADP-dependent NAD(P)H-hydrate dehydratase / NAD(P)H-hydrate epimerase
MKLYWARDVREADRIAIEAMGIPSLSLMENAARVVVRELVRLLPDPLAGRVAIVCGKGNNGGDGMAVARLLKGAGYLPEVLLLADPASLSGDARAQYDRLEGGGVPVRLLFGESDLEALEGRLAEADLVVDALLGTGLGGPVRGLYARAIAAINASGAFVVSVDIPSGLSGDALLPDEPAVHADLTLTLALPKPILYTPEASGLCGEVRLLDIEIPPAASAQLPVAGEFLDAAWAGPFFSARRAVAHKGDLGRLLIIAGGRGKSGAAVLAARGALRAGAGLVTVACPASSQPVVAGSLPEAMTLPLPETAEGTLSMDALIPLLKALKEVDAAAMGPGLGQFPETSALCREVYGLCPVPMVVDADGLNAFAGRPGNLTGHAAARILTPHPGEMARLAGGDAASVLAERYTLVPQWAETWNGTVLLKGHRTLVASPGRPWRMNGTGGPHMAGPGFGDVLTGVIAALLGRGLGDADAASLGAWWHGAAADVAAEGLGGYGLLASECADALPLVEGEMRRP